MANAGEIHQCVGRGGQVSWMDGACPAGSRAAASLAFTADDREEARWRTQRQQDIRDWQRRNRSEVAATVASARRAARGSRRMRDESGGNRCEQVRQRSHRIRDKQFMRMTYDRSVALDDAVREACR